MIQCKSPTNYNNEAVKEQFYMQPQSAIGDKRSGINKIVMTDLNAKLGTDNRGY